MHNAPEHEIGVVVPLYLPKPEEVWSIAKKKPKEDDMFTKQAVEEEAIKQKKKALEHVLQ